MQIYRKKNKTNKNKIKFLINDTLAKATLLLLAQKESERIKNCRIKHFSYFCICISIKETHPNTNIKYCILGKYKITTITYCLFFLNKETNLNTQQHEKNHKNIVSNVPAGRYGRRLRFIYIMQILFRNDVQFEKQEFETHKQQLQGARQQQTQ